ncbi:MAG: OsmC family protein [Spirochaetales bacterium]
MDTQTYSVRLNRTDEGDRTVAEVRDFSLTLGAKAGDLSKGFNPAETLLSSAGACITTSLGLVAENSKVEIDSIAVTVTGTRQSDPPRVIAADLELEIVSPATDEKLERVLRIAEKSSTIVSTLKEAMEITVTWRRAESG